MIRFESIFTCDGRRYVPPQWAYQVYSTMLSALPELTAEKLHSNSAIGLHQCLIPDGPGRCRWILNINGCAEDIGAAVETLERIRILPQGCVLERVALKHRYVTSRDLFLPRTDDPVTRIRFLTPTTFHTDGTYAIFPSLPLIIRSVLHRLNAFFPELEPVEETVSAQLAQQLWISDYELASRRFPIKGGIVHGFTGWIEVRGSVSDPEAQVWNMIRAAMPYTGVGAKTRIGMGAVACETVSKTQKSRPRVTQDSEGLII